MPIINDEAGPHGARIRNGTLLRPLVGLLGAALLITSSGVPAHTVTTTSSKTASSESVNSGKTGYSEKVNAARSMWIDLVNFSMSGAHLQRLGFGLSGGCWSSGESAVPPEHIPAGGTAGFGSESCGFMTGTAGYVTYRVVRPNGSSIGDATVRWSNPFIGRNTVTADVTPGIMFYVTDTAGNNARVTATLMSMG